MPNPLLVVGAITTRTIRIESPDSLLLIRDGVPIDQMTPECAIDYAHKLIGQARKAMERRPRVAEQVIHDGALLLRAGVPLGLSNDPQILDETRKEAQHNRDLRRHLPGGVKSTTQYGAPTVRHEPPKDEPPTTG